jgi:ubiquinone/menaquinone biosynthesis C-methylase UbiE
VADDDDVRSLAVLRHLGPIEGRRVLDLGCGKGRFSRCWSRAGATVVGCDVSRAMLHHGTGLHRVLASATALPFATGCFDAVVAIEVLEHVVPRVLDRVIGEVARVMRPGGRFVVVDKNAASLDPIRPWLPALLVKRIDERRGRWMYGPRDAFRERWFWPSAFAGRLRRSFAQVRTEYLLRPVERPHLVFRSVPATRNWVVWSALAPGCMP